jgi:2-polyprenyl-3-methyl-5-hydroxy-6-metoxy-1,4-benzoquinol methylase
MKKLTDKEYWDKNYQGSSKLNYLPNYDSLDLQINLELLKIISSYSKGKNILEIGAGDSDFLIYLASENKNKNYTGMDYSAIGCENLIQRSKNLSLDIDVISEDFFTKESTHFDQFSMVYSLGVVEHFDDLANVLNNTKRYCNSEGYHFASIPNMSGIYGFITKLIDKKTYEIHNPHDLDSFIEGHEKANMEVVLADYYGYFSAGLLASCQPFKENILVFKVLYKSLNLITKVLSFTNKHLFKIPRSSYFSPYILVVSKIKK